MSNTTKPFGRLFNKFREINQRYTGKRVEMSRGVKITLLLLRVYLLVLVGLMVYSFIGKI
jgi:hypothetical protein